MRCLWWRISALWFLNLAYARAKFWRQMSFFAVSDARCVGLLIVCTAELLQNDLHLVYFCRCISRIYVQHIRRRVDGIGLPFASWIIVLCPSGIRMRQNQAIFRCANVGRRIPVEHVI